MNTVRFKGHFGETLINFSLLFYKFPSLNGKGKGINRSLIEVDVTFTICFITTRGGKNHKHDAVFMN